VPRKGVRICKVEPGSLAENAGLEPRDEILAVNGQDVADELALKFYLAEGLVALDVRKADGREVRVKADMEEGQGLGVQTEDFRTRTCNNDCLFCFVKQLPPGVRRLLKVKDDDYRLSFLHGNYITLTNLSDRTLPLASLRFGACNRSGTADQNHGAQKSGRPGRQDAQAHRGRHPHSRADRAHAGTQ
jgi:NifB/MoaA-like Fe-S oxidoreductase